MSLFFGLCYLLFFKARGEEVFNNPPSPFSENPAKKSPATRSKFHGARGRGPIGGWLIKGFVEFQHNTVLVIEPRERSLVILPYGNEAAFCL